MLKIHDLHVEVEGNEILKGLSLEINPGEVHAIMGPNGSGKTTLAQVLSGHEAYEITKGEILYKGENIISMPPDIRAKEGIFLAFQYPAELPGVSMLHFLKTAVNEKRKYEGKQLLDAADFLKLVEEKKSVIELHEKLTKRYVNEGFSGGEKKRNEIFQMALLEPTLAILDETDSGLDIDALKEISEGINKLRTPNNSFILITHYQRILQYVQPDKVHILYKGKIIKEGGKELAEELEAEGYAKYI